MFRKIILAVALVAGVTVADITGTAVGLTGNTCMAVAPNDGSYMKTSYSVYVYTESGYAKGKYPVYLHKGKRYIDFNNTWIYIQGKTRFSYRGNWYVLK